MLADAGEDNLIVQMFTWWNEAYRSGGFTAEGFARFFTSDAPFVVGGGLRGRGPAGIAAHFQAVRSGTEKVELLLPVTETLASSTVGFVHYTVRAESAGLSQREECLAVAHFKDSRISSFEVIGREL